MVANQSVAIGDHECFNLRSSVRQLKYALAFNDPHPTAFHLLRHPRQDEILDCNRVDRLHVVEPLPDLGNFVIDSDSY